MGEGAIAPGQPSLPDQVRVRGLSGQATPQPPQPRAQLVPSIQPRIGHQHQAGSHHERLLLLGRPRTRGQERVTKARRPFTPEPQPIRPPLGQRGCEGCQVGPADGSAVKLHPADKTTHRTSTSNDKLEGLLRRKVITEMIALVGVAQFKIVKISGRAVKIGPRVPSPHLQLDKAIARNPEGL